MFKTRMLRRPTFRGRVISRPVFSAGAIAVVLLFSMAMLSQEPAGEPPPPSEAPARGMGHGHHGQGVGGTITAINGNSIALKTMDGKTAQVTVSDQTQFRKDRQPAKLADFKVGDEVFVRGSQAGDGSWQAEMMAVRPAGGFPGMMREGLGKQFIVGEVKAISGTQLTIARPDGVMQTITVDENTSFRKHGESITLADIKVGDHVFGRGELKDTVFVPAVLNLGEPRMMVGGDDNSNPGDHARGQAPPQP